MEASSSEERVEPQGTTEPRTTEEALSTDTQAQTQPWPLPQVPALNPAQAPYQPYLFPQPMYGTPTHIIPFSKTWHWIKIGFTVASILWCIILLGLSIAISVSQIYPDFTPPLLWCVPIIAVTAIWDGAELIAICARGSQNGARQGIHPGAHVGVDLVIWLASILCTAIAAGMFVSAQGTLSQCADSSDADYYDYCDQDEYDALLNGNYGQVLVAMMAFAGLLT
jgi:hypothetical protein